VIEAQTDTPTLVRVGVVTTFHLAQVNAGRILAPLDSLRLADFVARLAEVNALADGFPGFVWRLRTEDDNATAIRVLDDPMTIVNMSVWTSVKALAEFTFRNTEHVAVLRGRRAWFARPTKAMSALWWIPAGSVPTVTDAEERILHLREHGPTPHAFTFRAPHPAPGRPTVTADDDWYCPAP
jgi:uncharacterized protein DUF3291